MARQLALHADFQTTSVDSKIPGIVFCVPCVGHRVAAKISSVKWEYHGHRSISGDGGAQSIGAVHDVAMMLLKNHPS